MLYILLYSFMQAIIIRGFLSDFKNKLGFSSIACIVFFARSAIFQPFIGGDYENRMMKICGSSKIYILVVELASNAPVLKTQMSVKDDKLFCICRCCPHMDFSHLKLL